MSILAGDIGGTSTRLAWFEPGAGGLRCEVEKVYPSQRHAGLAEIVSAFLQAEPRQARAACFGVAGPVRAGCVETPNLPWVIETAALAARVGTVAVALINDLEANAWGIAALTAEDLVPLQAGQPNPGNACIISAGTGLGEAGLYWDGSNHLPYATEGGHADFAPRDELEIDLLRQLLSRFGRVSIERIVSGPGLVLIHEFLRARQGGRGAAELAAALGEADPAAAISRAALEGSDTLAAQALDRLVSLYGAEAGNLALKTLAVGGVYIGGGVAPKILPRLRAGGFMAAFLDKGRMRPLLEAMPVQVITNDKAALIGAARYAANRLV